MQVIDGTIAIEVSLDEFETRAPLPQFGVDAIHDRLKVETLVRPVRLRLLGGVQGIDDANPHFAGASGGLGRLRRGCNSRDPGGPQASGAPGREEPPSTHCTASASAEDFLRIHVSSFPTEVRSMY